eukprot:CAMPEP_0172317120 /NCGR_PEP_ID=MMETSP1058-20130122/30587_1 /TAXON_ID=83371 /ORGANISM="Detonula confervacea, Strain CCMP 353" /LENGTH=120 /DNA_ID=CAMNT_0013031593 /DNA_START=31 /DNA_END=390 /DNA_ORIENTATION=+
MESDDESDSGGSKAMETTKDGVTIAYLHRMIFYAETLAHGAAKTEFKTEYQHQDEGGDGESLVNILARELLLAADPTNLRSSLLVPDAFVPEEMLMDSDERMQDDDEDDDSIDDDDDEED